MTVVDEYLESPMEADDLLPCKGCGEVWGDLRPQLQASMFRLLMLFVCRTSRFWRKARPLSLVSRPVFSVCCDRICSETRRASRGLDYRKTSQSRL